MANKKVAGSIDFKGSVLGIGNVIGNNSSSHVEIKINLFSQNQIIIGKKTVELQRNPNFAAGIGRAFFRHPDISFPELNHLIGHQTELVRLLELYDYAAQKNKGAFVFLTGQHGYGTKALGRAFVDALRQGHGRAAITRFWAENNERHSYRDARWNSGFQHWQDVFDLSPDFLKQEDMFPFWGLFFQLCDQLPWMENNPLPTKLTELPAYFRNCTRSGEPLALLLEDFELASPEWHKLILYLAKEVDHALPILWIVTMHSDTPLDMIEEGKRSPAQIMALGLARRNSAEIYHLHRVSRQDVENYVGPAESEVAERLHRLTDGVPILVQNLWQDWQRTKAVFQSANGQWKMDRGSPWMEYGSGRDYIHAMLDQLWPNEDEVPWSSKQMYHMLSLAAREGLSFTADALAKAFNVEPEKLVYGLEYLLDEPDDPGLVKEAKPILLELRSTNFKRTLERFDFSPLLVWFVLIAYEKPDAADLIQYAEGLSEAILPFTERFAAKIADLYEQADQPELAKKYRRMIAENNDIQKMMFEGEMLLEFPESDITLSRLYDIAIQLSDDAMTSNYSSWVIDFASRLRVVFEKSKLQEFLGLPFLLLARSKSTQGDYQAARAYYEKMLAIEEKLMRKTAIGGALSGLGDVALSMHDYQAAYGYYEKALAIVEELGDKDGISVTLGGMGRIATALGDYKTGSEYYIKKLAFDEELGSQAGIAAACSGLGDVKKMLSDYQVAREYYEKALAINEELGRKREIAHTLFCLGDTARCSGDYQTARVYFERQLTIGDEIGAKDGVAYALGGLAQVEESLGNYQAARENYEQALNILENIGSPDAQFIRERIKKLE